MIVLPAELTQAQATACLRQLVQGLPSQAGADVQVDAGALVRFDTAALAVLLEFRRISQQRGKGLRIHNLAPRLADLARLYGVDVLLVGA